MLPRLPMLATKGTSVPPGEEWVHEVKWDGVRVVTEAGAGGVRMWSRNANDVTVAWPELSTSPLGDRAVVVDGEIIALNQAGLPDFRVLQDRMHVRRTSTARRLAGTVPATYMVFDLLALDGRDLTGEPLTTRRGLLEDLGLDTTWQVPAAYDDGAMLLEATRAQGLEGIVSKRRSSRYRAGERSPHWLKFAHRLRASYVVGGWRPQEGTRDRLAALLVGQPTAGGLLYRGRVGSGITGRTSTALAALLAPHARPESPFADAVPRVDAQGTFWVDPVVVVDVDTHQTSRDQRLRQPSFQGVRSDLAPDDLILQDPISEDPISEDRA